MRAIFVPGLDLCYNAQRPINLPERHILTAAIPTLLPSFEDQDRIFSAAFSILHQAVAASAFPAASIAVTRKGRLVALKAFGNVVPAWQPEGAPPLWRPVRQGGDFDLDSASSVLPATLFDLASVTKAVATTTMAAILYERGLLELDASIAGVIPEFLSDSDPRRRNITFRMLLTHSSGLPAYEKLFLKVKTRYELLSAAFTTPLAFAPNTRAAYSDIGFIILGAALERIAQESLEQFCRREVFGPLAMTSTTFNPPESLRKSIPPTQDDRTFRKRIIQGEVQDENASILGGVAGHAGLFSTAEDLAKFAHVMLQGGSPILRPETVALFTRRESAPAGTSRTLGWDTPSSPSQSGKYFGPKSYGHLGYTGTSLWIDPTGQLSITLLTNRTWPDRKNQAIKEIRPAFHDAVIEALPAN